jgi:hypothetical protein
MDALDTNLIGEYMRESAEENASNHFELMRFMTRNASAEIWGKADQAGLKPGAGPWLKFMNQHRTKRTATKAEAEEIVRLVQTMYGDDIESILEWLRHCVFDPLWALHNLNRLARYKGGQAEI